MLERLKRLLGGRDITATDAAWSCGERAPLAVLEIASAHELCEVLSFCSERGLAAEPAGAGTWLRRGGRAQRDYVVLSVANLNNTIEYEPEDLTASFEAGVPLSVVRQSVGAKNQMLALDPPAADGATIGACAALGSAGPLRLAYGLPRDQVLGLEVVTGDGRLLHVGGRVVKNVAGYDLTRLLVGSHGTLGVITRVNLRLRPLPQHDATWQLHAAEWQPLAECAQRLREAAFEPVAAELVGPHEKQSDWQLLMRVHGNDDTIAAATGILDDQKALRPVRLDPRAGERAWAALARAEANAGFSARLAALPSRLPHLIERAVALAAGVSGARVAAHAHDGIVRVFAAHSPGREAAPALHALRRQLIAQGGSLLLPMLGFELADEIEPYGPIGAELTLMREMKRVFDPAGVLAPARFVV